MGLQKTREKFTGRKADVPKSISGTGKKFGQKWPEDTTKLAFAWRLSTFLQSPVPGISGGPAWSMKKSAQCRGRIVIKAGSLLGKRQHLWGRTLVPVSKTPEFIPDVKASIIGLRSMN